MPRLALPNALCRGLHLEAFLNFFKHHLGDYDSATMHLSWDEDMAYTRLIRVYYRDEKPLPLELAKVIRLARAQTKAQVAAVGAVLREFFSEQEDGWHNKRCDEEIAAAKAQADTNRRIATNRIRHVNGSSTNRSPAPMDGRAPIQTPRLQDSTSQTPISISETSPNPLLGGGGGAEGNGRGGRNPRKPYQRAKTADELEREEAARAG